MAYTPTDRSIAEPTPDGESPVPDDYASSLPPPQGVGGDRPRLIEEHHIVGRYGEDELVATDERGRRWYHLRPQPRRRYDFVGFYYTWWLIFWVFLVFMIFLPWGRGWGY
jgi:hypothetical protein